MSTVPTRSEAFDGNGHVRSRRVVVAVAVCGLFPSVVLGNPKDGQVVAGSATIRQTSAKRLDVIQHTNKAVINWRQFNIGAGEHTNFQQPSASAMALNRVVGGDMSRILGRLTANGQIYLINPAGIFFGRGAQVDVAGLVASTADIRTRDFMAGRYDFSISGLPDAKIVNEGQITIAEGGMAVFVAPWVSNSGVIAARRGKVVLASGETFTLDPYGDSLIQIAAPAMPSSDTSGDEVGVSHEGQISADGGVVYLTAKGMDRALKSVVNVRGIVEAKSLRKGENGEIILEGGAGAVEVSGQLDATGEEGGRISVTGSRVDVSDGARVDASGAEGGGWIAIKSSSAGGTEAASASTRVAAGASIVADSQRRGDGGEVLILSDGTTDAAGWISVRGGIEGGDGGFAEVSGQRKLNFTGQVDASAPAGRRGSLLLDPAEYTVDAGNVAAINNAAADVTVQADNRVNVNTDVNMTNAGVALTLDAPNINIDCDAIRTNNGDFTLVGDTTVLKEWLLETRGGNFVSNAEFLGQEACSIVTKVNGKWGAPTGNDGDILFNGLVNMSHATRLELYAGEGSVTFQNNVTAPALLVWNCWDFNNNATLSLDGGGLIDVDHNLLVGFHTLAASLTSSMSIGGMGGLIEGAIQGGWVDIAGFGTVNLNVDVVNLNITGNPTGQVSGTVHGTANIPGSLTNNTNQGNQSNEPVGPIGPSNNQDSFGSRWDWDSVFTDWDQFLQAQQTLDDSVTGQHSDAVEDQRPPGYPDNVVMYQIGDTTISWPPEYWELQHQQLQAESHVSELRDQLNQTQQHIQDVHNSISEELQHIDHVNRRLEHLQNNLSNLLHAEDKFRGDPEAYAAWRDNVVNHQHLIDQARAEIEAIRSGISQQTQTIEEAKQQASQINEQITSAQQQAQHATQQMENIEHHLNEQVDKIRQQMQEEQQANTGTQSGTSSGSSGTSTSPQQHPPQQQSPQQEPPQAPQEPTREPPAQPSTEDEHHGHITGHELAVDLNVQLESSWVFWDKPLSAEDVHKALSNELLLGDTYRAGSDQALDALCWHERANKATESAWGVAGAVVDGTMQAVGALREAGGAVESIVETIEGALETYNTWSDRADKAQELFSLVASHLREQGWDTHTEVLEYRTQTVTATTYFNRQTGEYYSTVTSVPTGNSLTAISGIASPSAGNVETSYTHPTTSIVHGQVNSTEPSLWDHINPF